MCRHIQHHTNMKRHISAYLYTHAMHKIHLHIHKSTGKQKCFERIELDWRLSVLISILLSHINKARLLQVIHWRINFPKECKYWLWLWLSHYQDILTSPKHWFNQWHKFEVGYLLARIVFAIPFSDTSGAEITQFTACSIISNAVYQVLCLWEQTHIKHLHKETSATVHRED